MSTIRTQHAFKALLGLAVCVLLYTVATAPDSAEAVSAAGRPDGFPSAVNMASDMFLYIQDVPGESTDHAHSGWIEIVSLDTMLSSTVTADPSSSSGSGRTTGRADFSEITIGKVIDKSTPLLHEYCCSGRHIPQIRIELCRATGEKLVYMRYILQDAIISSVGPVTVTPTNQLEQVSFRFGEIVWEYTSTGRDGRPAGSTQTGWNLLENRKL